MTRPDSVMTMTVDGDGDAVVADSVVVADLVGEGALEEAVDLVEGEVEVEELEEEPGRVEVSALGVVLEVVREVV